MFTSAFVYPHSVPIWAIHLRDGLNDPCVFLSAQNILWLCDQSMGMNGEMMKQFQHSIQISWPPAGKEGSVQFFFLKHSEMAAAT